MKIAHFMYDDIKNPWLAGGGAVRLIEIYKRFHKRDDITIYTGNFPGAQYKEYKGMKLRRLGIGFNYLVSRITYVIAAYSLMRTIDADIIIEDFSPYSPVFSQINNKSIVLFQNIFKHHFIKSKLLLGFLPFFIEFIYLKSTKSIIASSNKLATIIKEENNSLRHLITIPYGVNENLFLTTPQEKKYILFLGRLDIYQKGIDTLLKAYNLARDEIGNLKLLIAGSGKDEKKVRQLIGNLKLKDQIEMLGRIEGEEKYDLLSSCLFLCMPSRFESWGIVAAEGMACAKPVIATKIEGLDEVIDEETGVLVPPDDSQTLAQAMIRLAKDKELRKSLGKRAREKARKYDWQKRAQATLKFYQQHLRRIRSK